MNIESATRRNSGDFDEEIDISHKLIEEEKPKKNGLVKKISQNGHAGNVVITKESLILMPDDVTLTNGGGVIKDQIQEKEIQQQQQSHEEIVTNHDNNNEVINQFYFSVKFNKNIFFRKQTVIKKKQSHLILKSRIV